MQIKDVKNLDLPQRIYMMEELWDSFKYEDTSITSPLWHKNILDSRAKDYKDGKIKTVSLDEVKNLLK